MTANLTHRPGVLGVNLAVLIAGCGVPFASVPSRIEMGGVIAAGSIPTHSAVYESATLYYLRAGLHPLSGFNDLHDRSFDVGGGYLLQRFWSDNDAAFGHHGFYLEGTYFLVSQEMGERRRLRWGVTGTTEYLFEDFADVGDWGPGATLGTQIEWSGTTATAFAEGTGGGLGSSAGVIGALYGEWAMGLSVSGGYRHLQSRDYYTLMVGAYARLPFGVGLAVVSN